MDLSNLVDLFKEGAIVLYCLGIFHLWVYLAEAWVRGKKAGVIKFVIGWTVVITAFIIASANGMSSRTACNLFYILTAWLFVCLFSNCAKNPKPPRSTHEYEKSEMEDDSDQEKSE